MKVEDDLSKFLELYRRLGLNVIPLKPRSKEPLIQWGELQQRKATDDELKRWFSRGDVNVGIVCGSVSGNLAVLDFESLESFERFFGRKPEDLAGETIVVRTSRGYHAYFRSGKPIESFKVRELQLDVKGEGSYVAAPPSIHPSGSRYEFIGDPWSLDDVSSIDDLDLWILRRAGELGVFRYGSEDDPPCIRLLLNGVSEGMRNESAVRLASYWLHFRKLKQSEVWGRLSEWNTRNKPPLDDRELRSCLESVAKHGYEYGCTSMAELGLCSDDLKHLCNLKESFKVTRKRVKYAASVVLPDGRLAEEAYRNGRVFFIIYNPQDESIVEADEVEDEDTVYKPIMNRDVETGQVLLPSTVEEYGDEKTLFKEVIDFLDYWHEQPDRFERILDTLYVFMTWVYDALPKLPYRRALGRWGSGKSAWLETVGSICYRPISLAGCDSEASLRRTFDLWRGTALIDEADFNNSSLYASIVKILNIGFSRNTGWFRCCNDENPEIVDSFYIYGPKLLATREGFKDVALESRCLTFTASKGSGEAPLFRGERFKAEALKLRNKLLLWRFRNLGRIMKAMDMLESKGLFKNVFSSKVELRIAQIILPLYLLFEDEEIQGSIRKLIEKKSEEVKALDPDSWLEEEVPRIIEGLVTELQKLHLLQKGSGFVKLKLKDIVNRLVAGGDSDQESVRGIAVKLSRFLRKNYGFTVRKESGNLSYVYVPEDFLDRIEPSEPPKPPSVNGVTSVNSVTPLHSAAEPAGSKESSGAGEPLTSGRPAPSLEDIQALLQATKKYKDDYWLASDIQDDYVKAGGCYDFWRLIEMLSSGEWREKNPKIWLEEHPRILGMFRVGGRRLC